MRSLFDSKALPRLAAEGGKGASATVLALVPREPRRPAPPLARSLTLWAGSLRQARSIGLLSGAGALYLVAGGLGMPVVAATVLGVGAVAYLTMVVRGVLRPDLARKLHGPLGPTLRPEVDPSDITADEIRSAYISALSAHEEVRVALGRSGGIAEELRDIYQRCGELVQAAGRVARGSNALHAYLMGQNPGSLELSAAHYERLAAATRDEHAASAFRHAASARRQHLGVDRELEGLHDRVKARLASVIAFLGMVHALVVKLDVLHFEQAHSLGASMSETLEGLRGEMELLGSSLEGALTD